MIFGVDRKVADTWIAQSPGVGIAGRLRGYEGLLLIVTLGVANLGWLAMTAGWRYARGRHRRRRRLSVLLGGLAVMLTALATWSFGWAFEHSYLAVFLLWLGLAAEALAWRGWVRSVTLAICGAYFLVVWQIAPLVGKPIRIDFLIAALMSLATVAVLLATPIQTRLRTVALHGR